MYSKSSGISVVVGQRFAFSGISLGYCASSCAALCRPSKAFVTSRQTAAVLAYSTRTSNVRVFEFCPRLD